jgi:hypothetical protein
MLACGAAYEGTAAGAPRAHHAPATTFLTSPIAEPTPVALSILGIDLFGKPAPFLGK